MNATLLSVKPFLSEDFLLQTETARVLYHDYAREMPIIDYHCHLPPDQIAADKSFANLTQIWLYGDHYKWRAMRTNGVAERYCTGDATDFEKFQKWAETVPYTMRNPLYHWTHLELQRYFGIDRVLNGQSAKEIYEEATALLNTPDYTVRNLLRRMNVETVCTTDDPSDDLKFHQQLANEGFDIKVLPTFRPDKAMLSIDDPLDFNAYVDKIEGVSNSSISTYDDYVAALRQRHDFFASLGGRLSDHGLEHMYTAEYTESEIRTIFAKARSGQLPSVEERLKFKSAMLLEFAIMDWEKGWTQQYHLGALRNNNARLLRQLGPDTGWDSIGDFGQARPLSTFLGMLDNDDKLAKTILYNLNPADNEVFATMIGNFNDGSTPGKIQWGSGWWFLDQKDGMEKQINALSNMGLLSRFLGMLTDSRSFLSYPRHEYFRRILCNMIGNDVENGELPADTEWLGQMVQNICYNNAKEYFKF
ncbi:glucuronate isomerase [Siphonobacter sp. SORGH_AS_0500]|uniref:glucuronate isomerase n=1 Tax=Siphonobacter sp. SORGH_AS_0500 TaxID=1864824 RepID=UPI000CACE7E7|nr:glucuronate isomerase [Siphonobacter sp. SORGH_AS_0500]MDR6195136.1 glucuronate isomerase [Siphonobacter sp. SORGH_AS_0500]PKK38588.1 glucuronate isomerase [Siphonobacter sp. SORGH_AS_0500]